MEFRRSKRSTIGIDMTPMIDCVFQLLIFFLLSSAFLTPAVRLQLPHGSAEKPAPQEAVVVTLDAAGDVFVNQEPVSRGALHNRLAGSFRQSGKQPVTLRADRTLAYEKVLEVLQTIQRAGATQVDLAYEVDRQP